MVVENVVGIKVWFLNFSWSFQLVEIMLLTYKFVGDVTYSGFDCLSMGLHFDRIYLKCSGQPCTREASDASSSFTRAHHWCTSILKSRIYSLERWWKNELSSGSLWVRTFFSLRPAFPNAKDVVGNTTTSWYWLFDGALKGNPNCWVDSV